MTTYAKHARNQFILDDLPLVKITQDFIQWLDCETLRLGGKNKIFQRQREDQDDRISQGILIDVLIKGL